jgi:hypothetical protein
MPILGAIKEVCVIDLKYINDSRLSDSIGMILNAGNSMSFIFAKCGFFLYEDLGAETIFFFIA